MSAIDPDGLRARLAEPQKMLIDGEWVQAEGGALLDVLEPARGVPLTRVHAAGPAEIDRFRSIAEKAGCFLTNLKMNQRDLNMDSRDSAVRAHAIKAYKRSIDVASLRSNKKQQKITPDGPPSMDSTV